MDRKVASGVLTVLASLLVGCGDSPMWGAAAPKAATLSAAQREPVVSATRQFLEAIIQGESERAINTMTPQARAQIRSSAKGFSPPALETATFRIAEVRMPSETQAVVQCYWSDSSSEGSTSEEMCCMLKLVDGRWGISGMAFQVAPEKPAFILNFEKPAKSGPSQQRLADHGRLPGPTGPANGPVRTAQQGEAAGAR